MRPCVDADGVTDAARCSPSRRDPDAHFFRRGYFLPGVAGSGCTEARQRGKDRPALAPASRPRYSRSVGVAGPALRWTASDAVREIDTKPSPSAQGKSRSARIQTQDAVAVGERAEDQKAVGRHLERVGMCKTLSSTQFPMMGWGAAFAPSACGICKAPRPPLEFWLCPSMSLRLPSPPTSVPSVAPMELPCRPLATW